MNRAVTVAVVSAALALCGAPRGGRAQENYEIQVYPAETVHRGWTMFELHSNFTVNGRRTPLDGMFATNHALHETVEITHGYTEWFEIGYYLFTSARQGQGWQLVGSHLRPRVRAPERWGWPVGVSISQEFGYQRSVFSADTWNYELRPIIDKEMGPWYMSLNPTLGHSLRGPGADGGWDFAPNVNVGYDLTKKINVALEYYGALGPLSGFEPAADQEHQLFYAVNLDMGPDWEFNLAWGAGLTAPAEKKIIKLILGRRVGP